MIKRILLLFSFCAIAVLSLQAFLFFENPPSTEKTYKIVEIHQGATFLDVTERLRREGLLTSSVSFRILGRLTQRDTQIKPGEYRLHRAMKPSELLDVLVQGKVVQHRVVIPEGTASREIGALLESAELLKAEAFYEAVHSPRLADELGFEGGNLEGYLFPETYNFQKNTPPEQVVKRMAKQFQSVYDEGFRKQAKQLGMTQQEVVTLASIIEKETGLGSERALISAVFHNRLKRKMRLQSDPTVIFSLVDFDGNLRRRDLFNKSPYNTYQVTGLPPGPISNPGREAIYAALYPADADYLLFVSKNNGSHFFSKTLEEHNRAVQKYQLMKNDEVMCRACIEEGG